jgi:hypothetical protein
MGNILQWRDMEMIKNIDQIPRACYIEFTMARHRNDQW